MESWSYGSEGKGLLFTDEMDVDAFSRNFGEEESGSKHCSSLMDSNSQESSLIDLKLGRLTDYKDAHHGKLLCRRKLEPQAYILKFHAVKFMVATRTLALRKITTRGTKFVRLTLRLPKFHLLAEFDEGKRSCRKRLAGHNERRRKLHFNTFSGKSHKLPHSFQGTKFLGTSIPKQMPFVIPNIFQVDFLHPERQAYSNQYQQVKSEEKPMYSSQSAMPITNGQSSFFHMHDSGKQHLSGTLSSATEAFDAPSAAPTVKELSGVSRSDCALSLLSAQSLDLSSHVTGIQMTRPLINQAGLAHRSTEKSAVMSYSEKGSSFYSCGMNPTGVSQEGSVVVPDVGHTANFEGKVQDLDLLSARYCLSPETGTTVDLLQLSTHLQRVEQQRNSMQAFRESCKSAALNSFFYNLIGAFSQYAVRRLDNIGSTSRFPETLLAWYMIPHHLVALKGQCSKGQTKSQVGIKITL
ncbi:hypothetical protein GOBAR_DD01570 [Gossypium barbadense]|nr:hypothetical protein GOBAR_DD01570 [Gossypium barbadense]